MVLFNKDKVVSEESKELKDAVKKNLKEEDIFKEVRDKSLSFEERLNAFIRIYHRPMNPEYPLFRGCRVWINDRAKEIFDDDVFKSELFELANELYDEQEFVWVDGYKRVYTDMTSSYGNFKYEIGKEYTQEELPILCKSGFHFCYNAEDTEDYLGVHESVLLKVRAYVPVTQKKYSYDSSGDKTNKCTCKRIKIIEKLDIEDVFPDEWEEKLYKGIDSYRFFIDKLHKDVNLKEAFKHIPSKTVWDFSIEHLKKYYGDSLGDNIFRIINEERYRRKDAMIFNIMIEYGKSLGKINVSDVLVTLKMAIEFSTY